MINSLKSIVTTRWFVLFAFLLEHMWLVWAGVRGVGLPMGDIIYAYHPWATKMVSSGHIFGLATPWVYPYPDAVFMVLPKFFAFGDYQAAWLDMSGAIDFAAMAVLLFWPKGYDRARIRAAWFWILAQIMLGPVSISRLDTISVSITIIGLVAWLQSKPNVAAGWFAVATWIKVWPVALLAATVAEARKWKPAAMWAVLVGGFFLVVGLIFGGVNSLSFVTEQTGRGIQIESPWATWWLWERIQKVAGAGIYYSKSIKTFQIKGAGVSQLSAVLGPTMYLAMLLTIGLGWWVIRKGDLENIALRNEVFAWTVLTAVLDMIVFNKVGSPQYYGWLIVPAILGLIERVPDWRIVVFCLVGILGLTGFIYPDIYGHILKSQPWATAILSIRNLAAVLLLVLGNAKLVELVVKQVKQKRAN